MSVEPLLATATQKLADAGVASPRFDAELLLSFVLQVPRGSLILARPNDVQYAAYKALVDRRAAREPLQHLTGGTAFRYVDLEVGPGVFIPRPETEMVAGWAIEHAKTLHDPVVVDLCTGSGAIALSFVHEVPHARVHAVELDEQAFNWAHRNLAGTGIDLRQGDMAVAFPDLDGHVDIVISNPPYIPLDAWESVEAEVRDHDPSLALWSGLDGLDAMRVVERTAHRLLKPGGVVAAEHADVQVLSAPAVFADDQRWTAVRDHDDLAGRPRFVTGTRR
ncbi:peptide chain release factor N(5)-glutamine methyltransferase [soil metagenome]